MYIKRPGPANYTKPVDLRTLYTPQASGVADGERPVKPRIFKDIYYQKAPETAESTGVIESVGDSFTRHVMLHGTVTMTGLARLERAVSSYGGYRRFDGIERHHHTPRPDSP